ncbi:DUF1631 domain-containing protein [uncultured Lamprocystis sp.]|jgi:hypothetical protein|uniref:DUF1631 domain-containing protein n=1 Tax=uncultured Lamprocystis sp. TaxID=543132 RepID=UPI0025F3DA8E|nr:DUF1631 domain-containing protein [uncultured Lamprocystis sp.]
MPDHQSSNALPLAAKIASPEAGQPRVDAADLLMVCRDRLAQGVATAFAENLGRANDDLLGMADRATSLNQQQLCFAAMNLLSNRGQVLLAQFRASYVHFFDHNVSALQRGRSVPEGDADCRLIDADDFQRDLAIDKLAVRAACRCASQLSALDRRLAALLQLPWISQDDNPLYPRALFAAMLNVFAVLKVGDQVALMLLKQFERQTAAELPSIYNDLNRHLIDYGILPEIPVGMPAAVHSAASLEPVSSGSSSSLGVVDSEPSVAVPRIAGAGFDLTDHGAPAQFENEVFAQLARVIATATGNPHGRLGPSAGSRPPESSLGLAQLIESLTRLQLGRADTRHLAGLGQVPIDPISTTVLRQLRATAMVSRSHPVDALTIDIVAMLFDAIFDDPDLSVTLRAQIAKLQIPVLKAALLDKAFFSNKRHPARRLLDLIANSGVGRNQADEPRLMARIQPIVDAVVTGFDTDINVFAKQALKLDDFLQDEDAQAQTRTTATVDQLAQRERQEVVKTRVDAEIHRRLAQRGVPALVAEFLDCHWRLVLTRTYVRSGGEGAPWVAALAALDDLIWSVQPKRGAAERNRLLTLLPDLLKRLRTAIEAVGRNDAWDPFFGQLIKLHVAALHKDGIPDSQREPSDTALAPVLPTLSKQNTRKGLRTLELVDGPSGIEYRPADPIAAVSQPVPKEDRHLWLARSLGVGAWVEFESFRGTRKTLRLNWISELRGVCLFANRQGENTVTLATPSLAEHLREGTARVLSQAPLTDRAVAHLLEGRATRAAT